MIAYSVALLSAFFFAVAMVNGPEEGDLTFKQAHHEYWGAFLVLLSLLWGHWLRWPGAFLMADDAVQHALQRMFNCPTTKLSLVDWLILKPLWKFPITEKLAAFFDRVFA